MLKRTFEPCIPSRGTAVPTGRDWIHEIKHDRYRLIGERQDKRVRLIAHHGYDWADRQTNSPVEAAADGVSFEWVAKVVIWAHGEGWPLHPHDCSTSRYPARRLQGGNGAS